MLFCEIGRAQRPNKTLGVTVESNNLRRNLIEIFLFVSVLECFPNCYQAHCIRCEISTVSRFSRIPEICLPRYLCFASSPIIVIRSFPTVITFSRWISFVMILVLFALRSKPIFLIQRLIKPTYFRVLHGF